MYFVEVEDCFMTKQLSVENYKLRRGTSAILALFSAFQLVLVPEGTGRGLQVPQNHSQNYPPAAPVRSAHAS